MKFGWYGRGTEGRIMFVVDFGTGVDRRRPLVRQRGRRRLQVSAGGVFVSVVYHVLWS